jgi:putative sterol carrier protein
MKRAIYILGMSLLFAAPGFAATEKTHYAHPQEVFDAMRKAFVPERSKGLRASYQWHLSGAEGGDWFVIVNDGRCRIGKGVVANPDVTFLCSAGDWVALSNGTLSGIWAHLTGRLKVRGPHSLARKLEEMFP